MVHSEAQIHGFCDEKYLPVRDAFAENFRRRLEVGASLAVTEGGRYVADLWGGDADQGTGRPWEKDTVVLVFSTTKIMTWLCVLILVDRGELDLDAPVAKYWPEFAQAGKETIPVRYVFSHLTGLAAFEEPIAFTTLCDWDRTVDLLARQKPWWEPGSVSGYHGVTQGFLLGELVRRISGASLGSFFRTEVAEKLDADFHIGLPKAHRSRRARLSWGEDRGFDDVEPGSVAARYAENILDPHWRTGLTRRFSSRQSGWRRICRAMVSSTEIP
jgi:CubicO group peptidase (beta-lactamase class C family)